ncbi:MAG: glycosyltransferase [Candidatus Omnitrophota bacterium]
MSNLIDISIAIPVKNGEKYIDSLLKAVFSQETRQGFEVIIIDSGSKDKTLDIVKQYPVELYKIKPQEFNHGLTRNFGISKAKGKYVVLMTQDAVPYDNHWLEQLINTIDTDENIAGVYSRQIPRDDAHPLIKLRIDKFFGEQKKRTVNYITDIREYDKLLPLEKHSLCGFDNVSSCIRREVWEKFPFSETDFAEDLDWSVRVLKAGYKIAYEPKSIVVHSHDKSIYYEYKRAFILYRKLYKLFRLKPVPSMAHVLYFSLKDIISGIMYTLKYKSGSFKKIIWLFKAPFISFFAIYGQYKGARK